VNRKRPSFRICKSPGGASADGPAGALRRQPENPAKQVTDNNTKRLAARVTNGMVGV
jgi:hypothetical protein